MKDLDILPGKTALQSLAVSSRTRERYLAILMSLSKHMELARVSPQSEVEWDSEVARLMDYLFADGEPAATGEKLLAAVLWRHPSLARSAGGRMALSRQALRGWRRVMPSAGRLPIPYPVVAMLAMVLMARGKSDLALLALLATEAYCRPSEPLLLRCGDVIPGEEGQKGLTAVSILLHPFELGQPAKNQEFDQSVMLDLPRHRALGEALLARSQHRPGHERLFMAEASELSTEFALMAEPLRLTSLGQLHAYRLRHTGASFDFATGARSLGEVQRRGRWRDARRLRRSTERG